MNLCIDRGNSRTKIGIFDAKGIMIHNELYKQFGTTDLEQLLTTYSIDKCILSSVVNDDADVLNWLQTRIKHFINLDHTVPVPITNCYHTPQTLGKDRLAAVVGANFLQPNTNLLVVDAGSAITYDFIDKNNNYIGGNIAPGLKMRLTALHQFTKKLPMVEVNEETTVELFGQSTEEAIAAGVTNGIIFEIEGYLKQIKEQYADVSFFLTGGNLYYFHNRLKIATFAEIFLVLIGLNRILEYNVQN